MGNAERITIELSEDVLTALDTLKQELGLRSRGSLIERLLTELLLPEDESQRG
ncbi:ribbon-helix-helix protein, CopG family [Synechococcus sp. W4D4]|uniref:ribbon-helix-helix protein, CopG family n=1 Tax=Synechococcus sp. W4D4 TaxID=3392294 RepID=UPI0039EBEA0D